MSFEERIERKILDIIEEWNEPDIYAISFLVTANLSSKYKGIKNFPEFSVGYNTESECEDDNPVSEERWNYAFWSQNNEIVVASSTKEMADALLTWYKEHGIKDIGAESEENMYDEGMNYIGKGPNGCFELMSLVADIASKASFREKVRHICGNVPIIIHDLEYSWYTEELTNRANPNGEAKDFLEYYSEAFNG